MPILGKSKCNYNGMIGVKPVEIKMKNQVESKYKAGDICTWTYHSDDYYNLQLKCDVQIAGGLMPVCPVDYLMVSKTSEANFSDGKRYCGSQSFIELSEGKRMTLKLFSKENSPGGMLNCTIKAVPDPCKCGKRNNVINCKLKECIR